MFSSKLIKSDDKSIVEIGENGILWKITSNRFHGIKNHQNWSWFRGEIEDRSGRKFSDVENREFDAIETKLNRES